jgi:hypothetical protein
MGRWVRLCQFTATTTRVKRNAEGAVSHAVKDRARPLSGCSEDSHHRRPDAALRARDGEASQTHQDGLSALGGHADPQLGHCRARGPVTGCSSLTRLRIGRGERKDDA